MEAAIDYLKCDDCGKERMANRTDRDYWKPEGELWIVVGRQGEHFCTTCAAKPKNRRKKSA